MCVPCCRNECFVTRKLLAIETSCDETSASVVDESRRVLSNVIATQTALHERFGGVVPEVASRAHVQRILPVIDEALAVAQTAPGELCGIAVATQPGLVGSLLVGLTAAKALAAAWNLPLVTINHIEAHLYACRMAAPVDPFPAIGLVVSGGHTNLYRCDSAIDFTLLGSTIDDAAGEAFDKVAAILGLPYPGGPVLDRVARQGNAKAYRFPRSFMHEPDRLEFSFSGLKTSVLYEVAGKPPREYDPKSLPAQRVADLAASFQEAVVDVLVEKCRQALRLSNMSSLCVGGGVSANSRLRERLEELGRRERIAVYVPPLSLCTDNAGMCGGLAWEHLDRHRTAALDTDVTSGLVRKRRG